MMTYLVRKNLRELVAHLCYQCLYVLQSLLILRCLFVMCTSSKFLKCPSPSETSVHFFCQNYTQLSFASIERVIFV